MPPKAAKDAHYRKKRTAVRNRPSCGGSGNGNIRVVEDSVGPLGATRRVKLVWDDETVDITSPAGTVGIAGVHVMRGSGAGDPSFTDLTGEVPVFMRPMFTLFSEYVVHSAILNCVFTLSTVSEATVGIARATTVALPSLRGSDIKSNGSVVSSDIMRTGEPGTQIKLWSRGDTKKIFGSRFILDDATLYGNDSIGGTPVRQWYFHIFVYNRFGTGAISVNVACNIEYDLTFRNPRRPPLTSISEAKVVEVKEAESARGHVIVEYKIMEGDVYSRRVGDHYESGWSQVMCQMCASIGLSNIAQSKVNAATSGNADKYFGDAKIIFDVDMCERCKMKETS